LSEVENNVALAGHTDAAPYAGGARGYSNWELSADRSNALRRELVAGGLGEHKIVRVVGLASSVLLRADDPWNPANRRISIVVLNKATEERIRRDGVITNAPVREPTATETLQSGAAAVPEAAATAAPAGR